MAYVRRATDKDATWSRAWTADAEADLADIPDPRRGDWAYVTALAEWRAWTDDDEWRTLGGASGPPGAAGPPEIGFVT